MFEQKEFRYKFPTVLVDTVFQWASYSFLILSVFEIRDTPADFPFGPDENNKPLEVNQRIKTASLVLLCIYMGLASLAMMLSLAFMAWEDQQRRQNWRTRKCSSFKKALMIFFFGPLHLNMLAQMLLGGIHDSDVWHLWQIRLVFFCRPFVHAFFYLCLIPIWSIIYSCRND